MANPNISGFVPKFATIAQTTQLYHCSRSFLYTARDQGLIKFYYLGKLRKPFVSLAELEQALAPAIKEGAEQNG